MLHRESLSDRIKEILLGRILSGEMKPGDRFVEIKIAREMQTSQAPVREALKELQAIGLLEITPNRGTRVRIIDDREMEEIYAVRVELEGLAAALVAEKHPELADELRLQIVNVPKTFEPHLIAAWNWEFHRMIVAGAENHTLLDLWDKLHVKSRTRVNVSRSKKDFEQVAKSHGTIVEAIAQRDPVAARAAAAAHVRHYSP